MAFYHHYLVQRRHDACGELAATRLLTGRRARLPTRWRRDAHGGRQRLKKGLEDLGFVVLNRPSVVAALERGSPPSTSRVLVAETDHLFSRCRIRCPPTT